MYHSVSDGPAPLCISPRLFRSHLSALEERGMKALSLCEYLKTPESAVALTFDDGYRDLLEVAAPALAALGWSATVFLADETVDRGRLPELPEARLVNWSQARELVSMGWEVGSHAHSHRDLTRMAPDLLEKEVVGSGRRLEQELGVKVKGFAAPFGRYSPAVRERVRENYDYAVGTRLERYRPGDDLYGLPRIEMHYFRNPRRWRAHLDGRGQAYFRTRQLLRSVKERFA